MRVIHVDSGTATDKGVGEFAAAIGGVDYCRVSKAERAETLRLLTEVSDDVAIVVAHGTPTADDIRAESTRFKTNVIHIAVSRGAPSLAIATYFENKVAGFAWLPKAGMSLGQLGAFIQNEVGSTRSPQSNQLLQLVQSYFRAAFDREELLAAYLVRWLYPDDVAFRVRLGEIGVDAKYADSTARELERALSKSF